MATGSYVYRDSGYGQRLILNLSRSGNTVSWTLQLQSTGAMYARVGLSGWISGQRDIAQGSAFTVTLDSGSYTNANAITATVSAKMFWGGTCTVTASLPAATPAPPAPSGITLASSGSTASYSWSATANTNTYYLQLNTNDGDYASWSGSATSPSAVLPGMGLNCKRVLRIYSAGPGGESAWAYAPAFYGIPATPTKPSISSGKVVSWTFPAKYYSGYKLERSNDGGATWVSVKSGTAKDLSFTDTAMAITSRYRVASSAGTGDALNWSEWSEVSDEARTAIYEPAKLDSIEAVRVTAGVSDPLGQTIRVRYSGSFMPDTLMPGNKWNLKYRYKLGTAASFPTSYTNVLTLQTKDITNLYFDFGGGGLVLNDTYDIELVIWDSYSTTPAYLVTVPVGKVAMSLGKDGIGVGRVWKEGEGALQVSGNARVEGDLLFAGTAPKLTAGGVSAYAADVIGRASAGPQKFASTSGTGKTLSAMQSAVLATLAVTVTGPAFVTVHGSAQARPGGNAAGNLEIYVDGTHIDSREWHSQSSTNHQWPSLMVGRALPAGSHTITLEGTLGTGSVSTTYDYAKLLAIIT